MLIATLRLGGERDRAAAHRRERGLHHPAVHQPHQPIALGGAHELDRRQVLAGIVAQPYQHLHRRTLIVGREGGDDRLAVELEAAVAQRRLQRLQPLDLAGLARVDLIARRIHRHVAALALGHVAGGIGRGERFLHAAAVARDLDQADADADVEDLVLPHEAEIVHRAAHVVGDLARLFQRAAHQQHAELIAADARHGIRVAHRVAQDLGDIAQHGVAGHMAAGVVDGLEAIQVQVAQHVRAIAAVRGVDRFLQPALELAPVDQPGQRIVRGLVGHLARHAAHLGDIVQQHHRADGLPGLHADRRGRQLDQVLRAAGLPGSARRAAPGSAACRRPAPGAPARPAACGRPRPRPRARSSSMVPAASSATTPSRRAAAGFEVVHAAVGIGRDQRFGQRLERAARARAAGRVLQRLQRLRRQHLDADDQQRALALEVDRPARQLQPRASGR